MRIFVSALLVALVASVSGGCGGSTAFQAVNPRPSVVLDSKHGQLALELGNVPDETTINALTITEFRQTLKNGFQNLAGKKLTEDPKAAALVLHIEQADLDKGAIGNRGGYIIIRYRATWSSGDGEELATFAGVAEPRNPTEPGARHLEDVVEVMYEQMVGALEKVQGVKTRE